MPTSIQSVGEIGHCLAVMIGIALLDFLRSIRAQVKARQNLQYLLCRS